MDTLAPLPQPSTGAVRASDSDRERVVAQLGEHFAQGRLQADELSERLDAAYAARTTADLQAVLRELPELPDSRAASPAIPPRQARGGLAGHLAAYVAVNALLVAIWAFSGFGPFWPMWSLLGWGIGLASHAREELAPEHPRRGRQRWGHRCRSARGRPRDQRA